MANHPDITRLHLGTENTLSYQPSALAAVNPNPSQYTPRKIAVKDITKEFADASAELRQGQLVKDDFFTLFESVGALEIMDPKMDSGFVLPEKDAAVDNFDPLNRMLPAEVIGIMDQMLCFEMAWHKGHALSQTLFTSLHMYSLLTSYFRPLHTIVFETKSNRSAEQADPLISHVLRAFLLGILKCCDSVIQEITSEHYYEEEDFVTQTFTQYILNDSDPAEIIEEIQNAIKILEQQDVPDDIKDAIRHRLELRVHLLEALDPLTAGHIIDKTTVWSEVLKSLGAVNSTFGLGKEAPEVFSERVQRHLASNTPPIPMIKLPWEEAYSRFKRLAEDNIEAHRIATIEMPSPLNIMRFAWDFSSRKPQPSTHSRAVMQGLLFKHSRVLGRTPHLDLLLEDLRSLVMAGDPLLDPSNWEVELPTDPRYQSSRQIDEFMAKALDEYINIPRMILQNRCRMRRTFCQSVAILDGLQAEAELIDSQLHELTRASPQRRFGGPQQLEPLQFYPLAAWSYFHKLRVMEWTVQLGFELEVYQPEELASMYRFLAFIAHTRREHLQHIDLFLNLRQQKLRKVGRMPVAAQVQDSRAMVSSLVAQATVTSELASALSTLYALIMALGLLAVPRHAYSTPALRHELRMKPYLPIGTPTLPSHEDLEASTHLDPASAFASVFGTISARLADAKSALAMLKSASPAQANYKGCEKAFKADVQAALGTCVAAGLVVATLKKVVDEMGLKTVGGVQGKQEEVKEKIKVEQVAEKRFAECWVVPKISGL